MSGEPQLTRSPSAARRPATTTRRATAPLLMTGSSIWKVRQLGSGRVAMRRSFGRASTLLLSALSREHVLLGREVLPGAACGARLLARSESEGQCSTYPSLRMSSTLKPWTYDFAQGGIFATDGSSPWGTANRIYVKARLAAARRRSPPPRLIVSAASLARSTAPPTSGPATRRAARTRRWG